MVVLVIGVLRSLEVMKWQVQQLQATTPSKIGRSGLKLGAKAPTFTLPSVRGGEISLADFAGRQVLLVFLQTACGPCRTVVPALNRVHDAGAVAVLAVNKGEPDPTRNWAAEAQIQFPMALQSDIGLSKRYEVFATPFAFLIDEQGLVVSKGLVGNEKQIGFVLERRHDWSKFDQVEGDPPQSGHRESSGSESVSQTVEVSHA